MHRNISSLTGIVITAALSLALIAIVFAFSLSFPKDNSFDVSGIKVIKKGIMVSLPKPGDVISSPLKIKGYVNGEGWIGFEGQVGTVTLYKDDGTQMGLAVLTATTDWMNAPVTFETELEFNAIASGSGYLIFRNENPSDLDKNNKTFRVDNLRWEKSDLPTVKVFFGNNSLDPLISCNKVFAVERQIKKTTAVARAALEELLRGPNYLDMSLGYYSSINPGVKIQGLTIENGIARVDFDEQLEKGIGGSCEVIFIRSQIIETLKQFPTVKEVIISINGRTGRYSSAVNYMAKEIASFLNFVREQGVVGLAVGFILGGAVSKIVTAIVNDIINPILNIALGVAGNLKEATLVVGTTKLMWGDFLSTLIDFLVIALVVYYGVRLLKLDKLDKKKEAK